MNTQRGSVLLLILIVLAIAAVSGAVYMGTRPSAPSATPAVVTEPDNCICTLQYDPVCGADGKTYGNACAARCAKVAVVSEGECQTPAPAPKPISATTASDPVACANANTGCEAHACRFSNGVCDMDAKLACQAGYQACIQKLPQTCFYSYNQCESANASTAPCPAGGCVKRDCLAEYKVCAKNPPALTGVCAQTIQRVCFAGAMQGDDIVRTCEDGTYVYQRADGTQYHGTFNYCD